MIQLVQAKSLWESLEGEKKASKYAERLEVFAVIFILGCAAAFLADYFIWNYIFSPNLNILNPSYGVIVVVSLALLVFMLPLFFNYSFWLKRFKKTDEWDEVDKIMTSLGYAVNSELDIYEKEDKHFDVKIIDDYDDKLVLEIREINLVVIKK